MIAKTPNLPQPRAAAKPGSLLTALLLAASSTTRATLSSSGSIANLTGDPWTQGDTLVVGHSGYASMLLNDHIDGNGITGIDCPAAYVAYGTGVKASLTMRGSGCTFVVDEANNGNLLVGEGVNSQGTFIMADGAQWLTPDYANHYIYLGRGSGSYGKMILTDPGTKLHLSEWLLIAHLEGARGRLVVENGAVCEAKNNYIGFRAETVGDAIVNGPGSILRGWGNSANSVGRLGRGSLTVENGGLAELRALSIGFGTGAYGEVLVTGAGSRLENYYNDLYVGLGAGAGPDPGEGVMRLARGGVLYTDQDLNVGRSSDNPKGTMIFTIGDNGGGTIIPGRAEVDGNVRLNIATLQMEVDPGVTLTLGQQFVLIDYGTLHATQNRFQNAPEGAVVVTPNHHAFRINYATDFDLGPDVDLALTATVVEKPTIDADLDDLLDAWELRCFGATDDPLADPVLDPDGDGRDTACEHAAGTDPLDPNSRCLTTVTDTPVGSPWDLAYSPYDPAVTYTVERATDPGGPWIGVSPTTTTINGATVLFTLSAEGSGHAFYHVKIER